MAVMMNMYETIRANLHFNKLAVGELLFVEYKCPIEQEAAGVWAPSKQMQFDLQTKRELDQLSGIVHM